MKEAHAYHTPLRFRIIRPPAKALFRLIFRTLARVTITGKEHIPYGKPYLVAINHVSMFDPPFAGSFWPEDMEMMGASDVFQKPGQGLVFKLYGVIPVHRGEYDRPLLTKVIGMVNSGHPVLIAPEGTRSHTSAMQCGKSGVAYIVEKTGVPVLPVAIIGTTEDFWERASHGKRPPLAMRIGKPISLPPITVTGSERHAARQRNTDLVMSYLAGLLPEEYRGVYAESAIFPSS